MTGQDTGKHGVEAGDRNFIQKASRLRRWWTIVPQNHLIEVWIPVYFIEGGGEEVK